MLPVFCLVETASLYFSGMHEMTGMSLGGESKAMKIKEKHQDNTAKLTAELKMVVPPPLTYTEALGLPSFFEEPANYPPFPCGIHFLIVRLLEPPHSTVQEKK